MFFEILYFWHEGWTIGTLNQIFFTVIDVFLVAFYQDLHVASPTTFYCSYEDVYIYICRFGHVFRFDCRWEYRCSRWDCSGISRLGCLRWISWWEGSCCWWILFCIADIKVHYFPASDTFVTIVLCSNCRRHFGSHERIRKSKVARPNDDISNLNHLIPYISDGQLRSSIRQQVNVRWRPDRLLRNLKRNLRCTSA